MNDLSKTYFIKEGYIHKNKSASKDLHRQSPYWGEDKIPLAKYYQREVYKYAAIVAKKYQAKNAVDVGCGTAYKLMKFVAPVVEEVTGIDQEGVIEYCTKTYSRATFFADDLESPTLSFEKKFDLVICSDVVEHVLDPDVLLNFLKTLASEKTFFVISTPERDILRGKDNISAENKEHLREWNTKEFLAYLSHHGFNVLGHRLTENMSFNFSKLYLLNKLNPLYNTKHNLVVLAKLAG